MAFPPRFITYDFIVMTVSFNMNEPLVLVVFHHTNYATVET